MQLVLTLKQLNLIRLFFKITSYFVILAFKMDVDQTHLSSWDSREEKINLLLEIPLASIWHVWMCVRKKTQRSCSSQYLIPLIHSCFWSYWILTENNSNPYHITQISTPKIDRKWFFMSLHVGLLVAFLFLQNLQFRQTYHIWSLTQFYSVNILQSKIKIVCLL